MIDDDSRAALESADPRNSVRLILPRDGEDGRDRYQIAADCFEEWQRTGALVVDDPARFYLYEMLFEDENGRFRRTHGVIGALGLPPRGADPGAVGVLPHERTMKTAKSDRLSLLRATRANLDPIWVLSLTEGLSTLLVPHRLPLIAYCEDGEGVTHRLFPLTAPRGHRGGVRSRGRRPGGARRRPPPFRDGVCVSRRAGVAAGIDDPGAERIMAFAAELADDELSVRPIHRLLLGLDGVDVRAALDRRRSRFSTPAPTRPSESSSSGLGCKTRTHSG